MKTLTDEEYEFLLGAANAWSDFTKKRVLNGITTEKFEIACISGEAAIQINGALVQTPFGCIPRTDNNRIFNVGAGDMIIIDREIKLTIS